MGACCSANAATDAAADKKSLPMKKLTDEYQVGKKLGVGASCSVVRATKKSSHIVYALKILKKDKADANNDNEFLFRNEVAVMRRLKHPNVVEFVEAFEDESTYNLVTVLCEGGELFDRVSEGSFSERDASRLARQMLLALSYLHKNNVVHRDLKPENFVFETKQQNSNMKLIDFGCAVHAADDQLIRDVAGSPYYVAPEVLIPDYKRTGRVWKAADMWSLGVIIFLLVHGYPPFNGETQDQIFHKIRVGKFRFSKDLPLSANVKDLISKLLVMDPMKRITADDALRHPWIANHANVSDTPFSKAVTAALGDFRSKCRLKKAVAKAVANMMTEEDEKQLSALFKQFDKDGNGRLDAAEIAAMMTELGKTPAEAKAFMSDFDDNADGTIDPEEFKTLYGMSKLNNADDIKKSFDMFDKDGDGTVSHDEIMKMCKNLTPDAAKALIKEVDKNGDGRVNFAEWLSAMSELVKKPGTNAGSAGNARIKF